LAAAGEEAGGAEARVVGELRCRYCGAPLPAAPDAVVVVCPYCGMPNWLRGGGEVLAAGLPGEDEAVEMFRRLAERDPDLRSVSPQVARVEVVLLPFYHAWGRLSSRYEATGFLTVEVARTRDGRTVTETRTVPFHVSGTYRARFHALLSARRSPAEDAVDELASHFLESPPGLRPLEELVREGRWRRGVHQALAADIDASEARKWFVDDVCDKARERVRAVIREQARMSYIGPGAVVSVNVVEETVPCSIEEMEARGPLLLPLVKAYYVVGDKLYRAFFAGWDGAPLVREEPMTETQRGMLSALGGALAGLLGAASPAAYAAAGGGWAGALVGLLLLGAGAAAGYVFARAAMQPARIERGGPHRWVASIDETVERALGLDTEKD